METVRDPIKAMEDELTASLKRELNPPPQKKPELEQLRDVMDRRYASACDGVTILMLDRDTAVLKVKADLKIQMDELARIAGKKIKVIEADFDKKSKPLTDMIEVAERMFD